ncbi:PREDICTED: odorant receptor 4-like [Trachymyrmex septentrionalis]|uniref:odorant receptor 4-like n=1 Tax=Trachymyrmex septentrionalis TaxID=34720 RepID=UPI00084F4A6E|nr:PREDICTED: odorant receptor 4-like [Trachymyrmex septentrionalis]
MKRVSSEIILSDYRRDNDYSLQLNRWFLKSIGAWPEIQTNLTKNVLINVLRLTCHSLIAFTVISAILYILFEEKDFRLRLKAIGPTSHILMGGINYFSLLQHNNRIRTSIEHMETDWRMVKREHDRELMLRNARVGRVIAGICALILQGGVICYNIARGMSRISVEIGNKTIETGRLPCPSFNKIIDTRLSPVYEIVLALQCLSTIVVNNITIGACGLAAVFAMHASGQLNVVMLRLEELVIEQQDLLQLRLANIVEHHLRTLRFLSHLEAIMSEICFVELIGCTFNLCMLGYYTITEWHEESINTIITYIMVLTAMMFNIFIFCFIGELVSNQCKKVGEVAYMTDWYQLPHKIVLGLILIILRSRIVTKITAGKIFHMSIQTFGVVIKTSVAYLNMLRTLTM